MNHQNVLHFFGLWESADKRVCIITELMSSSLAAWMKQQSKMPEKEVINILLQIAQGVKHTHDHGFVHRDLNLNNILVFLHHLLHLEPDPQRIHQVQPGDECVQIKVGDYGSAKHNSHVWATLTGTEGFQAPEMLEGKPCSFEVDIYAFGMIMWQLLHPDVDLQNVLEQQKPSRISDLILQNKRPDISILVPGILANLVKQCWHQDPKERPSWHQIIQDLSVALTQKRVV